MFYLIPIVSTQIGSGATAQTVNAPEYLVELGQPFGCCPFGAEGVGLVSTAKHATLDAATDVFALPQDLGVALTDADVTALDNYCTPLNIPISFVIAGMTWSDVIRQLAQIFLVAQAVSGANGEASLFPSGVTLDSSVAVSQQGGGNIKSGGGFASTPSALASAAGSVVGPFDLSAVDPSDTIETILLSVSQQFTDAIAIGQEII